MSVQLNILHDTYDKCDTKYPKFKIFSTGKILNTTVSIYFNWLKDYL